MFTVNEPLKLALVSPRVLLIAPLAKLLVTEPVVDGALTVIRITQAPLAPMVAPLKLNDVSLILAVSDPFAESTPVQLKGVVAGPITVMPLGKASVNVFRGKLTELGLLRVTTNVVFSPTRTEEGEKLTVPVGTARLSMLSVAVDSVVLLTTLPPSFAVKPPIGIFRPKLVPFAVDVTFTDHTQSPSLDKGM